MIRMTKQRAARWESDANKMLNIVAKLTTESRGIYLNAKGGRQTRSLQVIADLKAVNTALESLKISTSMMGQEFQTRKGVHR